LCESLVKYIKGSVYVARKLEAVLLFPPCAYLLCSSITFDFWDLLVQVDFITAFPTSVMAARGYNSFENAFKYEPSSSRQDEVKWERHSEVE